MIDGYDCHIAVPAWVVAIAPDSEVERTIGKSVSKRTKYTVYTHIGYLAPKRSASVNIPTRWLHIPTWGIS